MRDTGFHITRTSGADDALKGVVIVLAAVALCTAFLAAGILARMPAAINFAAVLP